jgi:hypothetical protein
VTVAQIGVVDWLGIETGTKHARLTVVDDLDWSDEHMQLLQEKLNTNLGEV